MKILAEGLSGFPDTFIHADYVSGSGSGVESSSSLPVVELFLILLIISIIAIVIGYITWFYSKKNKKT